MPGHHATLAASRAGHARDRLGPPVNRRPPMLLALWLFVVGGGFFRLLPLKHGLLRWPVMRLSNRQISALATAGEPDASG
jgi:hypothetical protein